MRTRINLGIVLTLSVLAADCASRGSESAHSAADQLRQATATYADLVAQMDHAAIAALFTPDGELVNQGDPPVRGPEAIEHFLESFSEYHVQANTLTADTVTVHASEGQVDGTYWQRVQLPDGNVVEVHGIYTARWLRGADGTWRIQRMATIPQQ
jgi:uncharacterized protein (TIGR02246 family)